MKNETTLTAKEEKIVKRCAAKYRRILVRYGNVIGWLGVVIFPLGILHIRGISEDMKEWIRTISIIMILYGFISEWTIIIGKLYERLTENKN